MVENRIVAEAFELDAFRKALTAAAGNDKVPVASQVRYLARYCKRLGAKTVVRENHYIDRHFLDEHALYYSRNLRPPPNHVRRFHVFQREFSDAELSALLEKAAQSGDEAGRIEADLSRDYLGFISIRPLPSVPVGRTVLQRPEDGEQRDIWATGLHDVHLANLKLTVNGLAFQQQDLAVGACATAAVWSGLSRVTRHEGMRAPTPAEVSQAAGRHVLPNGRTVPAVSGLSVQQLCEAIRSAGFAPEVVRADERPEFFVVALHTYLLSGIPVVLVLLRNDGQHAVTAVGFQSLPHPEPLLDVGAGAERAHQQDLRARRPAWPVHTVVPSRPAEDRRFPRVSAHRDREGP